MHEANKTQNMFAVIYEFKVKDGQEERFEESWAMLTDFIFEYEGSLGSRLHKQSDGLYIAYAQWPSAETWQNSGKKLPNEAKEVSTRMRESLISIETKYTLDMVDDRLR
jgi:heme-degrading monooxygenase HmoA